MSSDTQTLDRPSTQPVSGGWLERFALRRVTQLLEGLTVGRLTLALPDGSALAFGHAGASPKATLRVHRLEFFWRLVTDGDIGLGESYTDGWWDCDDLPALIALFHFNQHLMDAPLARPGLASRVANRLLHFARRNTLAGSRGNIAAHYDLGDQLYELFLDPSLTYSCAMFETPDDALEVAQQRKRNAVLAQAQLAPHHHLLEIGCGWGSLALDAAQQYGCRVTGITLSENQLARARERVRAAGLADRVSIQLCDYRVLAGTFDRIVSVEMIEAVGHAFLPQYFGALERLLAPDGVVVLQTITVPDQRYEAYRKSVDWLQKHIFPGGLAPSLTALCTAMTRGSRLVVESVTNIGPHYVPTLAAWRRNLDAQAEELGRRGYDAAFQRTWRYYLSYCEAGFAARTFGDLQLVLTRPGNLRLVPVGRGR